MKKGKSGGGGRGRKEGSWLLVKDDLNESESESVYVCGNGG
jgi:hypothetical protein